MYNQIAANKRRTTVLMITFFVFIIGLGYAYAWYSGIPPFFTMGVAAIVSIVMTLISYYSGDSIALSTAGAHEIKKTDNPYLYNMVENLCITGGMKTIPRVHIIQDPAINAFATGRDPEHASIAVTTGALERLENEELEGVIAHELSHIQNYDIRLMTVVIVLVGVIALLADMFRFGFHSRDSDSKGAGALAIVGLVLVILSPLIAELIKLAVSRRREYLADASGALLTRYPEGLARALEKIRDQSQPLQQANHATAHLYLDNPFRKAGEKVSGFLSTHPPLDDRIKALRGMGEVK